MLTYLEARRILAEAGGGPELTFLLAMSGTGEPLRLYLEAAGARLGRTVRVDLLPFNTLSQHLTAPASHGTEAFLLLPWDLCPEADWRSGVPTARLEAAQAAAGARDVAARLERRAGARFFYLPAPIPPLTGTPAGDQAIARMLEASALALGAVLLPADAFSHASYFASGCPIGGSSLGGVATRIVECLAASERGSAKVLVTDLDNTLWAGVIAEDGPDGVAYQPEGAGYRHFVYQTFLMRLRSEGVLLAGVSRNDPEVIRPPFLSGGMPLRREDFVALVASYHAKSAQIRQLASELNLGLDAFVFVDDNPVELEEVHRALPEVATVAFAARDDGLSELLDDLAARFGRRTLTAEDRERTALYQRRLEGLVPAEAAGADLEEFLAGLGMRLTIHDRSAGDRTRAVQLINKTNQFNANGRRWTDAEVGEVLAGGGHLYGATLTDRTGSHGEIIACLVEQDGTVAAFVMSCRVFQRRAEHAFLATLIRAGKGPARVRYSQTERNEPFARFLDDPALSDAGDGTWALAGAAYAREHATDLRLFEASWA